MSMAHSKPLVSIGMPVYNGERFIRQALDSLLAQDYEHFELTISDNASSDRTPEICQEYAARDDRIRYYRNDTNVGPLANLNRVLELAQAACFMWAAHDDVWEPSFVSTLTKLLEANPSAILAFCNFDNIDVDGVSVRSYPRIKELFDSDTRVLRAHRFIWFREQDGKANLIYGMMRTSRIRGIGGLRTYGPSAVGIDFLTVFAVALMGGLVMSEQLLFHKRLVPDSGSFHVWSLADWHAYRAAYRHVIVQSDIASWEKAALTGSAILRQALSLIQVMLRTLPSLAKRVAISMRNRIGSAIRFVGSVAGHGLQ